MNLIPLGTTVAIAAAARLILPFVLKPRIIGGFIPNVTVEEHHEDELVITEHPVENGAEITDHSYKRPEKVTIKCGWSNSSFAALGNPAYIDQIYQAFLALQRSRQPFMILTGKRSYTSMLARKVSVTTDEKTENILMMVVECQQVIIAVTQTVTVPAQAAMKTPAANAATNLTGTRAATPNPQTFNITAAEANTPAEINDR